MTKRQAAELKLWARQAVEATRMGDEQGAERAIVRFVELVDGLVEPTAEAESNE